MKTRRQKYSEAADHLKKAAQIMRELGREYQHDWDSDKFQDEINRILERDNGESGLIPFIDKIND